jgi:YD repeat-containing protein
MKTLFSKAIISLAFGLSFTTTAHAVVDMKNANYSNTWIDFELLGSGYDLRVSRTYNSRALHNGIFGFGWCSDFETKIDITAEGNLKLTECGAGQEIAYYPKQFDKKEIEKTVAQIADKMRASRKLDEKTIKKLAQDMQTNSDMRAKYAADYKIQVTVKDGTKFQANGQEVENIEFGKGLYTRKLGDGTMQRFNPKGQLTHIYDKNGNFLKFDYENGLIKEASDNNARKLRFTYYPNKKVNTISGPFNSTVKYTYKNLDDLVHVKDAWNTTMVYDYDDLHNLTKATYADGTFIALTYDKKNDWVTGFTDREKCKEDYKYEFSDNDPQNHYWATVKKTCGQDVVNESKHEFWYKNRPDGSNYLQRVASTVNGNVTDVSYHEIFGKPLSIRRNNETYSFDYYDNGQVKTKKSAFTKLTYAYDPETSKVSQVTTVVNNEKGAVVSTKKTSFRYDNKGNLVYADNSDGQKIDMTYDVRGRIASITDQAKKLVKIDYEDRFGRPAVVTRPGLGTIKVTYKPSGEIDKVNSNEGPTVAMQVASTFNNLLDIISPATAEVYN